MSMTSERAFNANCIDFRPAVEDGPCITAYRRRVRSPRLANGPRDREKEDCKGGGLECVRRNCAGLVYLLSAELAGTRHGAHK